MAEVNGLIIESSIRRMKAISKHPPVKCRQDVIDVLSDQTDDQFRVYQEIDRDDYIKTIATGMSYVDQGEALPVYSFVQIKVAVIDIDDRRKVRSLRTF